MLLHYYGRPFRVFFPNYTWRRNTNEKKIYLTFDDGPIPEVTEFVLDELAKVNVKATFFCVGDNVRKHPTIFQRLIAEGHQPANHTYNHLNGRRNEFGKYVGNVNDCQALMPKSFGKKLFRPPYGMISKKQTKALISDYEVVMWDVLSGDFHPKISAVKCLEKTIRYSRPGSIVLFHDSVKSYEKIKFALPRYLDHMLKAGYQFELL